MKNTSSKILGVFMTVAIIIGLLVPMIKTTPVAAGDMSWTLMATPNISTEQLRPQSDVSVYDVAADGKTMFAYTNVSSASMTAASVIAATAITVTSTDGFNIGAGYPITIGNLATAGNAETVVPTAKTASGFTVPALANAHVIGEVVMTGTLTTLATAIGATTVTVLASAAFPVAAVGTQIMVGDELLTYTANAANVFTVPAMAFAHPVSSRVYFVAGPGYAGVAYNQGKTLKSSDGGVSWTGINVGLGLDGNGPVTALSVSPDYATDTTVVATTGTTVYRSIDSGQTFGAMPAIAFMVGAINSIDVSPWYKGGQAILVGYANGAGGGGAALFTTLDLTWVNLTTIGGWLAAGDVEAVAFSPNHKTDSQYMVVASAAAGNTQLKTRLATNNWDADITATIIASDTGVAIPAALGLMASIAFPKDYDWSANNRVLVGIGGTPVQSTTAVPAGTGSGDLYRIQAGLIGSTSRSYDLNVNGAGNASATSVYSVAFKGNLVDGLCVVGQVNSNQILFSNNVTASTITWTSTTKNPKGAIATPRVIVVNSPTSNDILAATSGAQSGLYVSSDSGVSFDGLSLLDVSAGASLNLTSNLNITNDKEMWLTLQDNADRSISGASGRPSNTAGDYWMVFKTKDGATTWKMVFSIGPSVGTTDVINNFGLTRTYATDGTVYLWQRDTRFWKSSNNGATWTGYTAQANITAFSIIDKDTYYTGHANAVYKTGRYTAATLDGETASSFTALDANTLLVACSTGDVLVSTDDAVTFTRLGPNDSMGAGNTVGTAADSKYATNKMVFATSSGSGTPTAGGVYRWIMGQSSTWENVIMSDDLTVANNIFPAGAASISPDGTYYLGSGSAVQPVTFGMGVVRQVNPALAVSKQGASRGFVAPALPAESPWERMVNPRITGFDPLANTVTMKRLTAGGANTLYCVVAIPAAQAGSYGYANRIWVIKDNVFNPPDVVSPKSGAVTNPMVNLTWKAIVSPVQVTYRYQVATDAQFAGIINQGTTDGASFQQTGLVAGNNYFWRARVDVATPLASRYMAAQAFTVKLGQTDDKLNLLTPDPTKALDQPIRPVFSWSSVQNAESYELELADNPFFANSQVKKPLMNTVWAWDKDLTFDTTYYWRVRAVAGKNTSDWVQGVFHTLSAAAAAPPATGPATIVVTQPPAPAPAPAPKFFDPQSGLYFNSDAELKAYQAQHPATPPPSTPGYIWAVIIIGAVLVIAVIVLIIRTRRVP